MNSSLHQSVLAQTVKTSAKTVKMPKIFTVSMATTWNAPSNQQKNEFSKRSRFSNVFQFANLLEHSIFLQSDKKNPIKQMWQIYSSWLFIYWGNWSNKTSVNAGFELCGSWAIKAYFCGGCKNIANNHYFNYKQCIFQCNQYYLH